jgi:hypothetical protein
MYLRLNLVVAADDTAFEDVPKALNGVGVHRAEGRRLHWEQS